jgi:hypothetical protein
MNGIDSPPEQFVRALMRGSRRDFQAGYSPANAVLAVRDRTGLDEDELRDLTAYATGFADGMARAGASAQWETDKERMSYDQGVTDGLQEDPDSTQPVRLP